MREHSIVISLALFLSCGSMAVGQATSTYTTAKQFIFDDKFTTSSRAADLPDSVRKQVGNLANRNDLFSSTCTGPGAHKRLIFLAKNPQRCLVAFETGGVAFSLEARLYQLHKDSCDLLWQGYFNESLAFTPEAASNAKKAVTDEECLQLFRTALKNRQIQEFSSSSRLR